VEKIFEIKLTPEENAMLEKTIGAVKSTVAETKL